MANFQERENFWISCVHKSFYDCEQENDLYQYDCRQAPVLHGDGAGLTGLEPQNNHKSTEIHGPKNITSKVSTRHLKLRAMAAGAENMIRCS